MNEYSITVNRMKDSKFHPSFGIFGYIDIFNFRIFTVEKPWITSGDKWPYGKPSESCIPEGSYSIVKRFSSKKKRDMFYLVNEANGIYLYDGKKPTERGSVMFHKASRASQLEGCIGLGGSISLNDSEPFLKETESAESFLYDYIKTFNVRKCEIKYV